MPSIALRSNRPARVDKRAIGGDSDALDEVNRPSPNRRSIQQLTHQQLVTHRRRLLLQQHADHPAEGTDPDNTVTRAPSSPSRYKTLDPKASTTSVNTIVSTIESKIECVDVEKAIALLQELKKEATADELVALHRALLPVRQDKPTTPPRLLPIEELAYTSRQVTTTSYHAGPSPSGTLRVANGEASPEPSIICKLATEDEGDVKFARELSPPKKNPSPLRKRMTMAILNPIKSLDEAGSAAWRKRTTMAARPEESKLSGLAAPVLPDLYFARSKDDLDIISPRASIIGLSTEPSRGQLLSTIASPDLSKDLEAPQVVEHRAQSFDLGADARSSIRKELQLDPPLQRHSFQHIPKESTEDVPRLQPRWGDRASQLSDEYVNDCGMTQSPYEDKRGLLDFATRLSTVCDVDEEDDEDEGVAGASTSHADTLNKLTGEGASGEVSCEPELGAARSSDETDSGSEFPCARRGTLVRTMDSGYCSEVSAAPLPHVRDDDVVAEPTTAGLSEEPQSPSVEPTECSPATESASTPKDDEPLLDIDSLPTCEETFGEPSDATLSLSSHENAKRSPLSLFRSSFAQNKTFTVLNVQKGTACHGDISRSSTVQSSDDSRPTPSHKKGKKLQKTMPESVRHQRKKTLESTKALRAVQTEASDASNEQSSDPDGFVGCRPRDDSPRRADDAISLFSRKRSNSFCRKRSKTITDTNKEVSPLPSGATSPVSPFDRHRRRSKSIAGIHAGSAPQSRRPSGDATATDRPQSTEPSTPRRGGLPWSAHSTFASVASALSSHPLNASAETTRPVVASRKPYKRYYSMHQASSDGASMTGGNPIPVVSASPVPSLVAVGSNASVEDRFPGWEGKPATNIASQSPSCLHLMHTPRSYQESIPELPELPADIAVKVAKADELLAKKLKNSPRSSPMGSTPSSIDHEGKEVNLAKKRASPREKARQAALDKLTASYDTTFDEQKVDVSVKKLTLRKPSGQVVRWSTDGTIKLPHADEQPAPTSPTHDSEHPGWPGWETQSSLWRKRQEALPEPVAFEQSISTHAQTAPAFDSESPSIVVSRYITPLTAENVHNAGNAAKDDGSPTYNYAQEYSELIGSDQENTPPRPDMRRAYSAPGVNMTSATFVTVQPMYDERPANTTDLPRPNTGFSTASSANTTTTLSSASWAGSARSSATGSSISSPPPYERTKPGHFKAFRPTDAAQAERSRARSVARRSVYISSTESLGLSRNESLCLPKRRADLPSPKFSGSEDLLDRYGGGLGHGAFGGSAGTRASGGGDKRNGRCGMGEQYGLDMSDVPIFLRKV